MLKEIKFKEVYEYTLTIDIKENENIDDVIHEIPILIDNTEKETIRNSESFSFYNEYKYEV